MKNIFLLILLLIFLYFISNRYIEKFSVGGQSPINISGSLTLSTYCKDFKDSCINDSECKSNNCYKLECLQPKCETSSDCDNGKICWGNICDPTMTCEINDYTESSYEKGFCIEQPTCEWDDTSSKCKTKCIGQIGPITGGGNVCICKIDPNNIKQTIPFPENKCSCLPEWEKTTKNGLQICKAPTTKNQYQTKKCLMYDDDKWYPVEDCENHFELQDGINYLCKINNNGFCYTSNEIYDPPGESLP